MIELSRKLLKIGSVVHVDNFPTGTIATEEKCTLENLVDVKKKLSWLCWTVRTTAPRPLHKYYIVDLGKKDGVIVWKKSTLKAPPQNAKLWLERSGIEEMENISGTDPECFIYSMLVFILDSRSKKPKKFFCMERLRNGRIFTYEGVRVL